MATYRKKVRPHKKAKSVRKNVALQNYVRGRGCCLHWLSPRSHRCQGKVEFAHYPHTKAQRLPDKGVGLCTAAHTGSRGLDTMGEGSFRIYWRLTFDALTDEANWNLTEATAAVRGHGIIRHWEEE